MATLIIRQISLDTLARLDAQARAAGYPSREAWLRARLEELAGAPLVRASYGLICTGPGESLARLIRRASDEPEWMAHALSQPQAKAFRQAKDTIQRNDPGDRERAISLLGGVFDEVFELSV